MDPFEGVVDDEDLVTERGGRTNKGVDAGPSIG